MSALVLYDSEYGNTEKIAKVIYQTIARYTSTRLLQVGDAEPDDLKDVDLLVVGSPTQGGRATADLNLFLKEIPKNGLQDVAVTAFDTRFDQKEHGLGLKIVMKVIHFAAEKIASILTEKGGRLAVEPAGFIVNDKDGPLREGELLRAVEWAEKLSQIEAGKQG